jgi:hypothetical protein
MAEFRKTIPASRIDRTTWTETLVQNVVVLYLFFSILVLTGALILSYTSLPASAPDRLTWMAVSYGVGSGIFRMRHLGLPVSAPGHRRACLCLICCFCGDRSEHLL